jgi:hypothetical protein
MSYVFRPQEERAGPLEHLVHEGAGRLVEVRYEPPAVLEAAAAILVRPSRSLHHAVEGHKGGHHQLGHNLPLSVVGNVLVREDCRGPGNSSRRSP